MEPKNDLELREEALKLASESIQRLLQNPLVVAIRDASTKPPLTSHGLDFLSQLEDLNRIVFMIADLGVTGHGRRSAKIIQMWPGPRV